MEGRALPSVGRLHLDQLRPPVGFEARDVVARTVPFFFGDLDHLAREVITASRSELCPLMFQRSLFAGTAKRSISLVPSRNVEFARNAQHLLQFLRWRLV